MKHVKTIQYLKVLIIIEVSANMHTWLLSVHTRADGIVKDVFKRSSEQREQASLPIL